LFVVSKRNLLGHIVSKERVYIDLEHIWAIDELNPLTSHKVVLSFFGKINFVWRFILYFSSILKTINKPLKKDKVFELNPKSHKAFSNINLEITTAPVLVIPDLDNDFILYLFVVEEKFSTILTQKNHKGEEISISFMSWGL